MIKLLDYEIISIFGYVSNDVNSSETPCIYYPPLHISRM